MNLKTAMGMLTTSAATTTRWLPSVGSHGRPDSNRRGRDCNERWRRHTRRAVALVALRPGRPAGGERTATCRGVALVLGQLVGLGHHRKHQRRAIAEPVRELGLVEASAPRRAIDEQDTAPCSVGRWPRYFDERAAILALGLRDLGVAGAGQSTKRSSTAARPLGAPSRRKKLMSRVRPGVDTRTRPLRCMSAAAASICQRWSGPAKAISGGPRRASRSRRWLTPVADARKSRFDAAPWLVVLSSRCVHAGDRVYGRHRERQVDRRRACLPNSARGHRRRSGRARRGGAGTTRARRAGARFGADARPTARSIASGSARVVFADADKRARAQRHHPSAHRRGDATRLGDCASEGVPVAVYEAALLVENGVHHGLDGLIVVACDEATQLAASSIATATARTMRARHRRAGADRDKMAAAHG